MAAIVVEPTPTITTAAIDASRQLLGALPPAFLMLCLINVAFLGAVLWFLNVQIEQRTALASRIVEACLAQQFHPSKP